MIRKRSQASILLIINTYKHAYRPFYERTLKNYHFFLSSSRMTDFLHTYVEQDRVWSNIDTSVFRCLKLKKVEILFMFFFIFHKLEAFLKQVNFKKLHFLN